jgi:uncharacterized protein (DUF4213/DUF364 family)
MTTMPAPPALDPGPTVPRPAPGPAALVYRGHAGPVEEIPIAFAAALAARGVRVGGLAQRTRRHPETGRKTGMSVIDVATGQPYDIMQKLGPDSVACSLDTQGLAGASGALRRALDAGVDLLVASKFSHLEAEGQGLAHEMLHAMAGGVPVLTLVPESHALDWLAFTQPVGRILAPTPAACWRWWGPHGLYDELRAGVPAEAEARRVVVGLNWTLVEGPRGVGLAQTPARDLPGCRPPPAAGSLAGRPLAELAGLAGSMEPMARAIGAAALNAAFARFDLSGEDVNGLDLFAEAAAHADAPVMVGGFPGVRERVPHLRLIERAPGPDRYPEQAAAALIPGADAVLLTASTFANGSLPGLLALTRPGAEVALVGPGTPLAPGLLDHGITALAGFVAEDPDGLARVVAEGAGARTLKRFGRDVLLRRPPEWAATDLPVG